VAQSALELVMLPGGLWERLLVGYWALALTTDCSFLYFFIILQNSSYKTLFGLLYPVNKPS
jgi:hypothetical protein